MCCPLDCYLGVDRGYNPPTYARRIKYTGTARCHLGKLNNFEKRSIEPNFPRPLMLKIKGAILVLTGIILKFNLTFSNF